MNIKLGDFGVSNISTGSLRNTIVGTPDYLPPEIFLELGHGPSADIWNLGLLTYELLSGKVPFKSLSKNKKIELFK